MKKRVFNGFGWLSAADQSGFGLPACSANFVGEFRLYLLLNLPAFLSRDLPLSAIR
jgi:hypothetical protein